MSEIEQLVGLSEALGAVAAEIRRRFGDRLLDVSDFRGELTCRVAVEDLVDVLEYCRDAPVLEFNRLDCLVGNHTPQRTAQPFEVLYHLTSESHTRRIRVKAWLKEGEPVPTATGIWPSAGWDERETWEMYGIVFDGHPDLRRLLTVPEFEGYPLRKDFPVQGTYGGPIRRDLKGKI